jgi:hypothetical protein
MPIAWCDSNHAVRIDFPWNFALDTPEWKLAALLCCRQIALSGPV